MTLPVPEMEFEEGREYVMLPLFYVLIPSDYGGGVCMYLKLKDTEEIVKWTTNDELVLDNFYKFAGMFSIRKMNHPYRFLSIKVSKGFYKIKKVINGARVDLDVNVEHMDITKKKNESPSLKFTLNKNSIPKGLCSEQISSFSICSTKRQINNYMGVNNLAMYSILNGLDPNRLFRRFRKNNSREYQYRDELLDKYGGDPKLLFKKLEDFFEEAERTITEKNHDANITIDDWINTGQKEGFLDVLAEKLAEKLK